MADEITTEDIATAALAPAEVTIDGNTTKARTIDELIKARDAAAATLDGTGVDGGPRSPWGCLRPARAITGGAGPQ